MQRMTIYLPDDLHRAIVAHAEARGQKLSSFISIELAHLVSEPVVESAGVKALRHFSEMTLEKLAKRGGDE